MLLIIFYYNDWKIGSIWHERAVKLSQWSLMVCSFRMDLLVVTRACIGWTVCNNSERVAQMCWYDRKRSFHYCYAFSWASNNVSPLYDSSTLLLGMHSNILVLWGICHFLCTTLQGNARTRCFDAWSCLVKLFTASFQSVSLPSWIQVIRFGISAHNECMEIVKQIYRNCHT